MSRPPLAVDLRAGGVAPEWTRAGGRRCRLLPCFLLIGLALLGSACDQGTTTPAPPAPQPPNTPVNLRVSAAGEDFVEWSWNAVAGAAGYEVQFSRDADFTDADEITDTSGHTLYRRESLPAGTSVYLRVRAYARAGNQQRRSAWTIPVPAMTLAPAPPNAPANLRVSASGQDFIEWRWDVVEGASGYEIQFNFDGDFTEATEVIDTSAQTVYRRGSLPAGTSAFLRARAYAVVGDLRLRSGWSVGLPGTTLAPSPPNAPSNLRVSATGEDFIEWSWDPVEDAAGYEVQFSLDDAFTEVDEVFDTSARTRYRREGLQGGQSAFLRVRSYAVTEGEQLRSGWTLALPAMTLAPSPPGVPMNLRVSAVGEDFIEWRWDAVERAAGYEVHFAFNVHFTEQDELVEVGAEPVYRREGLTAAMRAFLRVRSYAETGDGRLRSGWTYVLPAMTLAPTAPAAPANLRVSATGEDFIEWSWDAVERAEGYEAQFSLDESFTDEDEVIERSAGQVSYRREMLPSRTGAFLRVRSYIVTGDDRLWSDWSHTAQATTLAPSPPQCSDLLDVEFLGRNEAARTALGKMTFQALNASGAVLDFVKPYTIMVPDGGANLDVPGLSPTTGTFVSDLRFVREDGWFQQTAVLEWVAGLEIRAEAAGCAPIVVSCDSFGCAKSGAGS